MTEDSFDPQLEVIHYRGFKFSVRQTPMDWVAIIYMAGGQPVVAAGHDRESAIAMATAWVDQNTSSQEAE